MVTWRRKRRGGQHLLGQFGERPATDRATRPDGPDEADDGVAVGEAAAHVDAVLDRTAEALNGWSDYVIAASRPRSGGSWTTSRRSRLSRRGAVSLMPSQVTSP